MNRFSLDEFPNSKVEQFWLTSPKTSHYNCIAWAYGDSTRWYWPDPKNIYFWPQGIPREITLDAFIKLYQSIGYVTCDSGNFEIGFEKVAIFEDENNVPTHAARQLNNGYWTSKLGGYYDIQHTIYSIQGGSYGMVAVYMKRQRQSHH